jgi:hypothetical protein
MALEKYGMSFPDGTDPLALEFLMIQRGGRFEHNGRMVGEGLFQHYKSAQLLVWPEDYHHRWTDLILSEIINNTITAVQGPKDTGKTRTCSKFALIDYWAFPNNTLFIISSTTLAALETRVWGDIKSLFRRATARYPWLAGHVLDAKKAIVTDDLELVDVRDMRKGILCVPCKNAEGEELSIASYVGIKQARRRHIGDEFQFMGSGMLNSIGNMNSGDYKGIFPFNPIGQDDPADQISEPDCGWEDHPEPNTTTVWKNKKFLNSRTVCLYGPDSPAIQEPGGEKLYPGLLNQDSIDRVIAGYGLNSFQYYSQCLGVRKPGINAKRVITAEFCKKFKVHEKPIWDGTPRTKIFALDAAYGGSGGDRCIGGHGEFGRTIEGIIALFLHEPQTVPISLALDVQPEYQISNWVKKYIDREGIPVSNVFYDSTGRGSLGPPLAQIVGVMINAVEFGGVPSNRPVTLDHMILDKKTNKKRLKLCIEHYRKFVTELWWTMRLAIESGQAKGLNQATVDEGSKREWRETDGNKIEVEAKDEMKKRTGYSPDLFDWAVTVLEGARRRGFQIRRMANEEEKVVNRDWIEKLVQKARSLRQSQTLDHAA